MDFFIFEVTQPPTAHLTRVMYQKEPTKRPRTAIQEANLRRTRALSLWTKTA